MIELGEGPLINQFKYIGTLLSLLFVLSTQADGEVNPPHQFRKDQCSLCHGSADGENKAINWLPVSSEICVTCHSGMTGSMSHPVDVAPNNRLPLEMPLVNGQLSCLTCHFVHPASLQANPFRRFLLRKNGMGAQFCMTCHRRSANDHTLFETAHPVSRFNTGRRLALDAYTLQCTQCHDRHLRTGPDLVGRDKRKRSAGRPGQPIQSSLSFWSRELKPVASPPMLGLNSSFPIFFSTDTDSRLETSIRLAISCSKCIGIGESHQGCSG